jgi:polyhydroxyalkanoate synthesis repressor PhaR
MSNKTVRIKRYPNRRLYASHTSRYVSLPEIEQMIRDGTTVEIVDSQTGEDLTRIVLMQIIAERHPEKIAMFPTAMLHSILRANDVMADFLREYFHNSIAYLDSLQKHGASASFGDPMRWMTAWLANWPMAPGAKSAPNSKDTSPTNDERAFAERLARLEERIADLEAARTASD